MSVSIAITVDPEIGSNVDEHMKNLITEAYSQQTGVKSIDIDRLSPNTWDTALSTTKSQAQKSLLERYNIRWAPENEQIYLINQSNLDEYSEQDIEDIVDKATEVIESSAKITGKSLKHFVDTW